MYKLANCNLASFGESAAFSPSFRKFYHLKWRVLCHRKYLIRICGEQESKNAYWIVYTNPKNFARIGCDKEY